MLDKETFTKEDNEKLVNVFEEVIEQYNNDKPNMSLLSNPTGHGTAMYEACKKFMDEYNNR